MSCRAFCFFFLVYIYSYMGILVFLTIASQQESSGLELPHCLGPTLCAVTLIINQSTTPKSLTAKVNNTDYLVIVAPVMGI